MSATFTWAHSGLAAKTGTASANFITDVAAMIAAQVANAAFFWRVASSESVTSPLYIVLKPKSGAAGRILIVIFTSAPANNNAAILQANPVTNAVYIAFFPAGNVDSPSNLTAASGTILGNDARAVKFATHITVVNAYGASIQPFYADSGTDDGGVVIGCTNPASPAHHVFGAGKLVVDANDDAHDCAFTYNLGSWVAPWPWVGIVTSILAGNASSPCVRTNYGATDRIFFSAWQYSNWGDATFGAGNEILVNTATNKAYFVPKQLTGRTIGVGFPLKMRQICYGPATAGPFAQYSTTGPVVAAKQFCGSTAGNVSMPWMTNFKV